MANGDQQTVVSTLSAKKVKNLEDATGRTVVVAVATSQTSIEFVTPQHEHFRYDRRRETFSRIPDHEIRHWDSLCPEV